MDVIVLIDFEHHEQMYIIHANYLVELNYQEQLLNEYKNIILNNQKLKLFIYHQLAYL
jgi:hypothetical protein